MECKCICGENTENGKTISIFDNHVLITSTCKCGRRIHKSFELTETTFFFENKIEKIK